MVWLWISMLWVATMGRAEDSAAPKPTSDAICRILLKTTLEDPKRVENAQELVRRQLRLQRQYEFWKRHLGRDSDLFETLRMRQVMKVRRLLRMKDSPQVASRLSYLFKDTLLSFYLAGRDAALLEKVAELKVRVAGKDIPEKELHELARSFHLLGVDALEGLKEVIESGNRDLLEHALDEAVEELRKKTLRNGKILAAKFDEYSAAFGYLRKLTLKGESEFARDVSEKFLYVVDGNEDPGHVTKKIEKFGEAAAKDLGPDVSDKAADVLRRLNPEYLLGPYFHAAGIRGPIPYPKLSEFYAIINRFPEIEMHRMKMLRNREIVDLIFATGAHQLFLDVLGWGVKKLLPSQWIYFSKHTQEQLRSIIEKLPKEAQQIQKEKYRRLRTALRTAQDAREYYFDIESIAHSLGSGQEKLNAMLARNASTDDAFMTLFARRVDLREAWKEMREAAAKEGSSGETVFKRMEAAEQRAKVYGDLSLETYSQQVSTVRWFIEWLGGVGAIAGGTWGVTSYFSIDEVEMREITPVIEDETPRRRDERDDRTSPRREERPGRTNPSRRDRSFPESERSDEDDGRYFHSLTPAQRREVDSFLEFFQESYEGRTRELGQDDDSAATKHP